MSDINEPKKKSSYSSKEIRNRISILVLFFIFSSLICQWSYYYYRDNAIRFPWGTQTYTVDAGELELLPNEQTNYLGTRADEDNGTEFVYHANNMYLTAASGFSIRTGPGVYYHSIGRMYYGREVHVIGTCDDNDWYLIEFYGEEAYVHSACLFESLPEITPPEDEEETDVSIQGTRPDEEEASETDETVIEADETEVTEAPDVTEEAVETAEPEQTEAATPTPTPTVAPTATPAPTSAPSVSAPTDPVMLELFNLVNDERTRNGLEPLSWSSALAADAAVRAQEISVSFSHTRPDGTEWWTVDPDRMYGENLASGQSTAQEVFTSWMNSPGHKANILGSFSTCGFALYYGGDAGSTYYWVQEFGY